MFNSRYSTNKTQSVLVLGKKKSKYRELSEEEKNIKREYGKNRYHNMSEEKKTKTKRTPKKIIARLKNLFHRCRYGNKGALQNCYHKNIFSLFFY